MSGPGDQRPDKGRMAPRAPLERGRSTVPRQAPGRPGPEQHRLDPGYPSQSSKDPQRSPDTEGARTPGYPFTWARPPPTAPVAYRDPVIARTPGGLQIDESTLGEGYLGNINRQRIQVSTGSAPPPGPPQQPLANPGREARYAQRVGSCAEAEAKLRDLVKEYGRLWKPGNLDPNDFKRYELDPTAVYADLAKTLSVPGLDEFCISMREKETDQRGPEFNEEKRYLAEAMRLGYDRGCKVNTAWTDLVMKLVPVDYIHKYGPLGKKQEELVRARAPEDYKILEHPGGLFLKEWTPEIDGCTRNEDGTPRQVTPGHAPIYRIPFDRALDPDPEVRNSYWTYVNDLQDT